MYGYVREGAGSVCFHVCVRTKLPLSGLVVHMCMCVRESDRKGESVCERETQCVREHVRCQQLLILKEEAGSTATTRR